MKSDFFFTDEVVIEEFHETSNKTELKDVPNNICKTVLSNIVLIKAQPSIKKCYLTNSSMDLELPYFSENKLSKSESIEDTCSGSSLNKFDSSNNSDSCDDDTFLEDNQKRIQKDIRCDVDNFLDELKIAIKIKWIDRAIYIKKTIQKKSQDLWDQYFKSLTSEEQSIFSNIQNLRFIKLSQENHKLEFIEEIASEMLNEIKNSFMNEEVNYSINISSFLPIVPKVILIVYKYSLIIWKPEVQVAKLKILEKKTCNLTQTKYHIRRKEKLMRSMSESKISIRDKNSISNENYIFNQNVQQINLIESLQNKNKNLVFEINNKERIIAQIHFNSNEFIQQIDKKNRDIKSIYGIVHQLKTELVELRRIIHKYELDNNNLNKINENLEMFKINAENFILTERKNNITLTKQIETLNTFEYDYQWLQKAFMDYKSLGQDYDNLQFRYFEIQMQLSDSKTNVDALHNQIKYLEKEIINSRIALNKFKNINRDQHENLCNCQRSVDCRCHSHSRNRSNKPKKEKKSERHNNHSDECDSDLKSNNETHKIKNSLETSIPKEIIYDNSKPNIKELEQKYDFLQIKKRTLESELCHVPINGTSSIRQSHAASRGEKEYIENELDKVDYEISSIRRTLKQFNVIGDRALQ